MVNVGIVASLSQLLIVCLLTPKTLAMSSWDSDFDRLLIKNHWEKVSFITWLNIVFMLTYSQVYFNLNL